ncbi:MAG: hypothetical protein JWP59_707 [Massilia sp.]|nr:hypothetical protein [Massilia sp.]
MKDPHMKSIAAIAIAPLLLLASVAAPAAPAAPLFKPGLWEINNQAGGANGSQIASLLAAAQQQMNSMEPSQRRKIESMMARNGVVVENGGISAKACITPAMAARQQIPVQQKGNCSYRFDPVAGNTMNYSFTCSSPAARGEGSAVFSSPTNYTARTRVSGSDGGSEHSMTIESSGRWLSEQCGSIAPAEIATN